MSIYLLLFLQLPELSRGINCNMFTFSPGNYCQMPYKMEITPDLNVISMYQYVDMVVQQMLMVSTTFCTEPRTITSQTF